MSCEIVLDSYDAEMPEFFNAATVKARKDHKCHECYRVIPTGEQYFKLSGKWDGEMSTFKVCLDCEDVRRATGNGSYGALWDELEEWFPGVKSPQDCMDKMKRPSAKAYFRDKWLAARDPRGE